MATLQDTVREVVQQMVDKDELFTALDVSNKVKQTMPHATHRSIRDEVRHLYAFGTEFAGYKRTPIDVVIEDGSTQQALLYHPFSDSWDLDNRYDAQKRNQVSVKAAVPPQVVVPAGVPATLVNTTPPSHWGGALPPVAATKAPIPYDPLTGKGGHSATITVSATATVPMPTARDLWKQLFATQPSMFPTK
jgi:hypothetical protein